MSGGPDESLSTFRAAVENTKSFDLDGLAKEVEDLNLYDETHIKNEDKIEYLKRLEASASINKKIVKFFRD